ncbi:MAG: carboxypeptidase-like regulatory domain-containing protein [Bacteroidota bacterium]
MKTFFNKGMRIGLAIILFAGFATTFGQTADESFFTITGIAKDAKTRQPIVFASVSIPGTSVGTVANSEGEFILKVNKNLKADVFEISHLGYINKQFKIAESLGNDRVFYIEEHIYMLKESSIRPNEPENIVRLALRNTRKNYSEKPNMMTGFYRETIKQHRDYLSISEAVVDIYKASYTGMQDDQVKISKGRNGSNLKKADTLMVKLQGGPNVAMLLDIIKNPELIISPDSLDNYEFEITSIVNIDDKPNYVISFVPSVVRAYPLYIGKLYITQDNLAITMAEFSLDLTDAEKAARQFIQKKPAGLLFTPTATSYLVTYKEQNGKYYFNYVRVELKFKCDWKRKWFKNNYTIISEIAITDRREDNISRFTNQELFKSSMVFAEKIKFHTDPNYWGEYNIIEPEESIQNAIKKFSKNTKQ